MIKVLASATLLAFCAIASCQSLTGIGLPSEATWSSLSAVSRNGSAAAGAVLIGSQTHLIRWTRAGGIQMLGDLPGWDISASATDISGDGAIIVGYGTSNKTDSDNVEAFRWTQSGGIQGLGFLSGGVRSQAHGISDNGLAITGYGSFYNAATQTWGTRPFRWTASGFQMLPDFPGGQDYAAASGISGNGSVIVGGAMGADPAGEAFRWTSAGMVGLGDFPGGATGSQAYATSNDGSVIVGVCDAPYLFASNAKAFRWTAATGFKLLARKDGLSTPGGAPSAVSGDGAVIVGTYGTYPNTHGYIWSEELGWLDLQTYLASIQTTGLTNWIIRGTTDISLAGKHIVGYGTNPDGKSEGFIVSLDQVIALESLTLSKSKIVGGQDVNATAALSNAAPAGGAMVALADNSGSINTPASLLVPAGSLQATALITTSAVGTTATRQISATYKGITRTASLTLIPAPRLSSLALNPNAVVGGTSTTGTVTLTSAAAPGGTLVSLSDNTAAITTPANVTLAEGTLTGSFNVTTSPVSATASRIVTATLSGVTRSATLTLHPSPGLKSLVLNPTSVAGGRKTVGTISLNNAAPTGGALVTLTDNTSVISTPPSALVAAGHMTKTFEAYTGQVSATSTRQISATLANESRTANLTISPGPTLLSISLNPTSVKGGTSTVATVKVSSAAPTGGLWISLTDNSSAIQTPQYVQIPAGTTQGTATITTSVVSATVTRQVSAIHGITKTANLTLTK